MWWHQGESAQPALEYRMKAPLFGAFSSPRSENIFLMKTTDDKAQFQNFSDLSQDGYEKVSYLRLENNNASCFFPCEKSQGCSSLTSHNPSAGADNCSSCSSSG